MRKSNERGDLYALPALGLFAVLYLLWQRPLFSFNEPLLFAVVGALAVLAWLAQRVPVVAWLYWLAGVLTLVWSLAPGNTLISGLWELLLLAALAAGSWRVGFWGVNILLLGSGLFSSLALNAFNLQTYLSGSVHYVMGAQALVVLPLAYAYFFRVEAPWQRLGLALLLIASAYGAMISGARAVYLPLILVLGAAALRLVVTGRRWYLVAGSLVILGAVLFGLDRVMPNQPMATALGTKATPEVQAEAAASHGVFTQRLRFWDQTFAIALDRPLGSGTGSYQAVIHAYQKYPMLWSNSPHNVLVETVATGGWPRLILLLLLLVVPILRGWLSKDWPYALAAAAIWTTLMFDVTSYYPSFMMLAFASLGPLYGRAEPAKDGRGKLVRALLPVLALVVATVLTLWWYLPCTGPSCAVTRYLGVQYRLRPALAEATPAERADLIEQSRQLYPKSLWVLRAEQVYLTEPASSLALAREIAQRFPYQHPQNFLDWAEAALQVGDEAEARAAITLGLSYFPADSYPFGEMRVTPEQYQAWLDTAQELLGELEP